MMKIFMALAIALFVLTAQVGKVSAAGFTHEQLDKVVDYLGQHPATSLDNAATFKLNVNQLQKNFNAELEPMLKQAPFDNDEQREVMETLFLIKDYKIFEADEGKVFLNVFGNSVAIFGVMGKGNDNFKLLTCAYTVPENKNEMTLSSLILASFVKVILPKADPEQFLHELANEQSGNVIRDGVKFTLNHDDGFILVSAAKE